jgi:hypothetical protein
MWTSPGRRGAHRNRAKRNQQKEGESAPRLQGTGTGLNRKGMCGQCIPSRVGASPYRCVSGRECVFRGGGIRPGAGAADPYGSLGRTGQQARHSRLAWLEPSQSLHCRRPGGHYARRARLRAVWRTGLRRHAAPGVCLALPPVAGWPRGEHGHHHWARPPRHLLLARRAQ